MSPIIGVRTTGPDNCSIGPISGTNCPVTIVLRGEGLPTALPSSIGVAVSGNESIVTVEDNDDGSNGWLAGHDTDFFTTCKVIIGVSTSTELIFQVGNIGPTCPNHSILPGDKVEVTLFNPNFSVFGTQTATAGTPAADPDVPVVSEVVPPYGPVTGGTNSEPGTGRVTVAASNVASPVAAWFGDVATSDITRVDDTHVSVVPPPSTPDQDNEGIALQLADSVTGTTPQHCAILLPTGCANQFFYLSENSATFTSPPLDLDLSLDLGSSQSVASKACAITGSTGHASGLTANAGLHGGPVSVTAGYGVSKSSAGVPEAFVGSASITVENAIEVSVALAGTVSACQQIPIPNLGIPGIAGFYFVVGGSIEADVTLTITIHAGTYSLSGGFMPGSNPGDLRGVTMDSECVDDDGNPVDECVTTEFSAALTGTLAISPLWLQIGPDFANVGAGLSAAAIGTLTYPPLAVDGDICVAGNWVAQATFGPLSASTGGSWLGPFNVVGNGALCPFGDAGGDPPATPTSTGLASSANPSAPGDEVTFTASVTPTPAGGTVDFTDNGEDIAECQDVAVDESGNAPCAVTYDDPGSHAIVASYGGAEGFEGSASSTVDQVVSDAPPATPTSTGLVPSLNPSAPGDEVTFTATVSPTPSGGTVSFTDEGAPIADCQDLAVDEAGSATCAVTFEEPGSHSIVATFSGDEAFEGSASSTLGQVVTDGPLPEPTATEVVASANPSAPGQAVAFTASVSPIPDDGRVSFTDNGEEVADCQDIALDPTGGAVCTLMFATVGTHAIVATYSGHDAFAGSVSSTLDQVVSDATPPTATAIGLASSSNPSVPGELLTYTASVSPTPDGGTVSFTDEGAPIAECQEIAVDESGDVLCPVTYGDPGSHAIVASYSGSAAFVPATSEPLDQQVTTASDFTAAATPSSGPYGTIIELSASDLPVSDAASTVTFASGSTTLCVALVTDRAASCTTSDDLPPGEYPVTATWSGPPERQATTSFSITQPSTVIVPGVVKVAEYDEGMVTVELPVTLSGPSSQTVSANWQTANGQAVAPADYVPAYGSVIFEPGETQQTVSVTIAGDELDEADESVYISLRNPTNARIGGFFGLGFVVILDDEATPNLRPGLGTVAEGDDGSVTLLVPVELSGPSGGVVTAEWATRVFGAATTDDFVEGSGTVTFAPGQTEATVSVTVKGDTLKEGDEYFGTAFRNATNAHIGGWLGLGFGHIIDDD